MQGEKKREVSSFSNCDRIKQMYHDLWGRKQTFGIIVRKVCKHSNKITNSYVKKFEQQGPSGEFRHKFGSSHE